MSEPFLEECVSVLERTPATLDALLRNLPEVWTKATDGPSGWSPYAVIGHLIHAEKTDWIPRLTIILEHGLSRPFEPFDREAQFRNGDQAPLPALLDELQSLRRENLDRLRALNLSEAQLDSQGTHPTLGPVTARQLLATWAAHDLGHVLQISRTMARRYKEDVGPWAQFLSVMNT